MQMTNCDRATANLVANEILDLDRQSEQLLTEKDKEVESVMSHYDEGCKKWAELFAKKN